MTESEKIRASVARERAAERRAEEACQRWTADVQRLVDLFRPLVPDCPPEADVLRFAASTLAAAEAREAALRGALDRIAKGEASYRGGGGYFCRWCDGAAAEDFADRHPPACPRSIARAALAAPAAPEPPPMPPCPRCGKNDGWVCHYWRAHRRPCAAPAAPEPPRPDTTSGGQVSQSASSPGVPAPTRDPAAGCDREGSR